MLREVFEKGKELADKVTNAVMNYTEVEAKVRAATNDDPWGPHGQDMQEIAEYTKHYDTLSQVMGMLWRRMFQEQKCNWRRTYKSLLLLSYLLRNGSERIVVSCKEHVYDLRLLESYQYIDENGKDQGVNIRHKAKDIIALLENESQLSTERKKSAMNRNKYQGGGISSSLNGHHHRYCNDDDMKPAPSAATATTERCSTPSLPPAVNGGISSRQTKPISETNSITLPKPSAVIKPPEQVADLLDLNNSSPPPPPPPPSLLTSTAAFPAIQVAPRANLSNIDNTFDPFNLGGIEPCFTAPPVPSQPTSPIRMNDARISDDFDNFVSAVPMQPSGASASTTSHFDELDFLFASPSNNVDQHNNQPIIERNTQNSANSAMNINDTYDNSKNTGKIGSTWSNVGSIDISLDSLGNRRQKIGSAVTSSKSLNQLQKQNSYNSNNANMFSASRNPTPNQSKQLTQNSNLSNDKLANPNLFSGTVNQHVNNNQFVTFDNLLH